MNDIFFANFALEGKLIPFFLLHMLSHVSHRYMAMAPSLLVRADGRLIRRQEKLQTGNLNKGKYQIKRNRPHGHFSLCKAFDRRI